MLVTHALPMGILYGVFVHLAMSQVIVPMSRLGRAPFNLKGFITMTLIHMVCVGLPIALTVRGFARSAAAARALGVRARRRECGKFAGPNHGRGRCLRRSARG